MALIEYAVVTVAEVKQAVEIRGTSADSELEGLIAMITDELERAFRYEIVSRLVNSAEVDTVEVHDFDVPQGFVYAARRPIRSITTVELAGEVLNQSDYVVDMKTGLISLVGAPVARVECPRPRSRSPFLDFPEDAALRSGRWFAGHSGATLTYKGGFSSTAAVSTPIKHLALDMIARLYRERERKSVGLSSEQSQGWTQFQIDASFRDDLKRRVDSFESYSRTARR